MSRALPSVDPNFIYEDKLIMRKRAALALIWLTVLTEDNRNAWRTRWLTNSPTDITGHVYTPYTPTQFAETHVEEATAYAWSQMYGFLRFNRPAVLEPINSQWAGPSLSNLSLSSELFAIDYDASANDLPTVDILVFASGPIPKTPTKHANTCRPMCAMPALSPIGTLDFWRCWHHRYGNDNPSFITATAGLVNTNNELVRSFDVLSTAVLG